MYIVGIAADCSICHSSLLGEGIVVCCLFSCLFCRLQISFSFARFHSGLPSERFDWFFVYFVLLCSRPDCLSWYDSFCLHCRVLACEIQDRTLINIEKSRSIKQNIQKMTTKRQMQSRKLLNICLDVKNVKHLISHERLIW
jgi:hypothetical protein